MPFQDCASCGCPEGFGGSKCQCQSAVAQLVLEAKNDVLFSTQGKLSFDQDNQLRLDQKSALATPFKTDAAQSDMDLYNMMIDIYNGLKAGITTDGVIAFTLTPRSDRNDHYTTFDFTITFGCEESNPQIATVEALNQAYTAFAAGINTQPVIQKYFGTVVAPTVTPPAPSPGNVPTPNTETPDGTDPNVAVQWSATFAVVALALLVTMF